MTEMKNMLSGTFTTQSCIDLIAGYLDGLVNENTLSNKDPNGFNADTVKTLRDADKGKNLSKVFSSVDELFEDLNA